MVKKRPAPDPPVAAMGDRGVPTMSGPEWRGLKGCDTRPYPYLRQDAWDNPASRLEQQRVTDLTIRSYDWAADLFWFRRCTGQ